MIRYSQNQEGIERNICIIFLRNTMRLLNEYQYFCNEI